MSASRDPDLLLRTFLEEGPEVLPDRVMEAIADDVHRHRQRTPSGPWRLSTVRTFMASAAVLAIVVAGAGILWATRPPDSKPGNSTTPTASPVALPAVNGVLDPGVTYDSGSFSHPFVFTVPVTAGTQLDEDMWAGSHTLRLRPQTGGAITIHDGRDLPNDLCNPTAVVPDLPNVEDWIAGSEGLTVSPVVQLTSSTLSARYWDIELGPGCYVGDVPPGGPAIYFQAGEHHRLYEVQVGGDTILVATWGLGYQGNGDNVLDTLNPLTDEIVSSMQSKPTE